MSHRKKRLLVPGVSLFVLVVFLTLSAVTRTAVGAPSGGQRVVVELTLDSQTNMVKASPDPVALHYGNKEYADWVVAKGSAPFEFTIGIEDQTNRTRGSRPRNAHPLLSAGAAKHCASIIPTSAPRETRSTV